MKDSGKKKASNDNYQCFIGSFTNVFGMCIAAKLYAKKTNTEVYSPRFRTKTNCSSCAFWNFFNLKLKRQTCSKEKLSEAWNLINTISSTFLSRCGKELKDTRMALAKNIYNVVCPWRRHCLERYILRLKWIIQYYMWIISKIQLTAIENKNCTRDTIQTLTIDKSNTVRKLV